MLSVIARYTEAPPDQLSLDASFEDLGIDSLGGISIIADLEYTFDVVIPNEEAYRIRTVGEAIESLQKHRARSLAQDQNPDERAP